MTGQADASETGLYFAPESMAFVIIDVDSKDRSVGMACPPPPFIEQGYLRQIHRVLRPDGILVVNLSARDPSMLEGAYQNVAAVFPSVFLTDGNSGHDGDEKLDEEREDLNIALFATRSHSVLPGVEDRITSVESALRKRDSLDEEVISDLKASCEGISIWHNNEDAEQKATKKPKRKRKKKKKK